MFGIPVGLLIRVGIGLAVVAALWLAWHTLTNHYREQGRVEIRAEWELDKAKRIKLTTDITNAWNEKRIAAEKAEQERDDERRKRMELASERARTLPPAVAAIRVPRESVRVLNDAIRDSAKVTGPAAEPAKETAQPADSTIGLLTQWGVACISAYEEARGMVEGWQDWYGSLQKAQGK